MAIKGPVRHAVPNLQRRGNMFYWRIRIPVRLQSSIHLRHLAFSLKQSDHHRAGYMVRKLNLLLHEISLKPEGPMLTKESLERLFQSEIDRMNRHMAKLQFSGQRSNSGFQNLENMSADIEAGWAYRLLEKFGTRQLLFKHENCVGYNYLKSSSVPQELYTNIITTYEGEKYAAETSAFKREIEELMQEHGISIDIFNTEKAKAEYFRARADTLLDTEERYLFKYPASVKVSTPSELTSEPIKKPLEAVPPAPAPQISEPAEPPVPMQMPEPVMAPAPAPKSASPKV